MASYATWSPFVSLAQGCYRAIWLIWSLLVVLAESSITYKEPRLSLEITSHTIEGTIDCPRPTVPRPSGSGYSTASSWWKECLSDGIRLHIDPVGVFVGHVYVTGQFMGNKCHLDYCSHSTQQPFFMEVPYRGGCNVRRHRSPRSATVSYEVTVVIQRHPQFITAGDRAYRLSCIYRQVDSTLTQKLDINELSATSIEGTSTPDCRYDVLKSVNGPALRLASVGEPVVHKWTCNTDDYGFVVHSCVVRNQFGNEYQLIDERGCVIEKNLVPDVIYSPDLSFAYTTINAFRFAEQLMVHFACQITLCRKNNQGCEGISPPTCSPVEFPPIQATYRYTTEAAVTVAAAKSPSNWVTKTDEPFNRTRYSSSAADYATQAPFDWSHPVRPPSDGSVNQITAYDGPGHTSGVDFKNEYSAETSNDNRASIHSRRVQDFRTETITSSSDYPVKQQNYLLAPPLADVFYPHRKTRSSHDDAENISVEVETKKVLVFSSDESERFDFISPHDSSESAPGSNVNVIQMVIYCCAAMLQALSVVIIILQHRLYRRSVQEVLMRSHIQRY